MTSIAALMEGFTLNTRPITMRARDNLFVAFCDLKVLHYLGHTNITSAQCFLEPGDQLVTSVVIQLSIVILCTITKKLW